MQNNTQTDLNTQMYKEKYEYKTKQIVNKPYHLITYIVLFKYTINITKSIYVLE